MQREPVVFLVDDDPGVRKGLGAALESAGLAVRTFESAEEFLSQRDGGAFGCLLLDLRLGTMSGVQLLEKLRDSGSEMPVIVISGHGDITLAVESMRLGAVGFLQKPLDLRVLLVEVRAALDRARDCQSSLAQTADARVRLSALTPRERELLQMLVDGKSSKQIAAETGLSLRTVNNHRTHLLDKTGAEKTPELVRMAMPAGVTSTLPEH
jgi:two-component system, LuxR family, response regulator FixJ